MVLEHHEHLDGSGYPNYKKVKDILLGSQIIAIADMVDTMTSHRPYSQALSPKQVISELNREKGSRLNEEFCDIAIDILKTY